jgi:radical SAM superfamily enzyme YgiQ (UPF0313 family)
MNNNTSKIVLATANAKYAHSAFALKYLMANLGKFQSRAAIFEFTINDRPVDAVEKLLFNNPDVIALSVYIWNGDFLLSVAKLIKQIKPQITLVCGGPEVSYPEDPSPISDVCDATICGEGEVAFYNLLSDLEKGIKPQKFIQVQPVNLENIKLPYYLYSNHEIEHKIIYVEASRGCAFKCEFCISSLDKKVRHFETSLVLDAFQELWDRGARKFKFIDRTIHLSNAKEILQFFLEKLNSETSDEDSALFLHFEIVPSNISEKLIEILAKFPNGVVQLEAGIQSFNSEVLQNISRKQDIGISKENIRRLLNNTGVHLHSDLIAGLPGESFESFANSFNELYSLGVDEIQVGVLKLLRGAPIKRHTEGHRMVYKTEPSYDILQNDLISFMDMQRIKRFARYFDLVFNNGNFKKSVIFIWHNTTPFDGFMKFSDWLFKKTNQTSNIALVRLGDLIFEYLTAEIKIAKEVVADTMVDDFKNSGQRRLPVIVRDYATVDTDINKKSLTLNKLPKRQKKHIGENSL